MGLHRVLLLTGTEHWTRVPDWHKFDFYTCCDVLQALAKGSQGTLALTMSSEISENCLLRISLLVYNTYTLLTLVYSIVAGI